MNLTDKEKMYIWDQVWESDPSQLKKVDYGRKFLSIDAYPQIKKATQLFGPMGIGFGVSDVEYDIMQDVPNPTKDLPNQKSFAMVFRCTFWYIFPGSSTVGKIPIVNSGVFEARSDTPKKLLTNSISKALSYLGFNYDVFCGSWDDDPYSNRPEIPCPQWLKENFNRLLNFEVEGEKFFDDKARESVMSFQIDAGWTLQSVTNFVDKAIKRIEKAGHTLPNLLQEGDSTNGIREDDTGETEEASEEKAIEDEEKA